MLYERNIKRIQACRKEDSYSYRQALQVLPRAKLVIMRLVTRP